MLVGVCGMSYEQVARACGCEVGTVKSRLSRARDALKSLLARTARHPRPRAPLDHAERRVDHAAAATVVRRTRPASPVAAGVVPLEGRGTTAPTLARGHSTKPSVAPADRHPTRGPCPRTVGHPRADRYLRFAAGERPPAVGDQDWTRGTLPSLGQHGLDDGASPWSVIAAGIPLSQANQPVVAPSWGSRKGGEPLPPHPARRGWEPPGDAVGFVPSPAAPAAMPPAGRLEMPREAWPRTRRRFGPAATSTWRGPPRGVERSARDARLALKRARQSPNHEGTKHDGYPPERHRRRDGCYLPHRPPRRDRPVRADLLKASGSDRGGTARSATRDRPDAGRPAPGHAREFRHGILLDLTASRWTTPGRSTRALRLARPTRSAAPSGTRLCPAAPTGGRPCGVRGDRRRRCGDRRARGRVAQACRAEHGRLVQPCASAAGGRVRSCRARLRVPPRP